MTKQRPRARALKKRVLEILKSDDLDSAIDELLAHPPRRIINPLLSFLYYKDEQVKWRAVTAIGAVVEHLANQDMESARVIMRRLMWNLNDESGGIGWGTPEAMGEILARHKDLASEYAHILLSYTMEEGNYLEYEFLQRGLLWGIGRLAQSRPGLVRDSLTYLTPYIQSADPAVRGHAAWAIGLLGREEVRSLLQKLFQDENAFILYDQGKLTRRKVKDVAKESSRNLASSGVPEE